MLILVSTYAQRKALDCLTSPCVLKLSLATHGRTWARDTPPGYEGRPVCTLLCHMHMMLQGSVIVKQLDLADLKSVQALAADISATEPRLDRLILNAGVMACPKSYTKQNFEIQMGTNHFGHFLLSQLLVDKMKAQVGAHTHTISAPRGAHLQLHS